MIEDDVSYFRRRSVEERTAAGVANSQAARASHLELALRHGELADSIAEYQRILSENWGLSIGGEAAAVWSHHCRPHHRDFALCGCKMLPSKPR